jgi:hypothetical protein
LTPAVIGSGEFATFLAKAGAIPDPRHKDHGRVSLGNRHVWIFLGCENDAISDLPAAFLKRMSTKLGGAPRSSIVLEISRTPGSEALAKRAAFVFAGLWPAVLTDLDAMILTADDLRHDPDVAGSIAVGSG